MDASFAHPRLSREWRTVDAMLHDHCRRTHRAPRGTLCPECDELRSYALKRLQACVFQDEKPTCSNCPVHCYGKEMRERMRVVMRSAGPRMILSHPYLALMHKLDGFRKAPDVREAAAKRAAERRRGHLSGA
jgi:hypothetical protein